jgi:glycerophosphoryl diester phosphodiesterase
VDWRAIGVGLRVGGHRGAAGRAPENTFAGFELAWRAGADYLELDVQLTADERPVAFHDESLERTTDGHGSVAATSWTDLQRLDAGAWFEPRFAGQRIPSLAAVLAWLEERPPLGATIEAKGAATGAVIAEAIIRSRARDRLSICSSAPGELLAAAAAAPEVPRLLIVDRDEPLADPFALARAAGATGVNLPWRWCSRDLVARFHDAGLLVAGGTVDDIEGVKACLALGLDVVDSNVPDVVVSALVGG